MIRNDIFTSPVRACRHGRACPGHPRRSYFSAVKTWMPGTSPGMTKQELISAAMNLLRDRRLGGREEYLSPVIPGSR
jgi:hypothetical protein